MAKTLTAGGKPKKQSIITSTFQGELEVTTLAGTGKGKAATSSDDVVERIPFMLMGLELPPTPLFKDALEKNIIPQVKPHVSEIILVVTCYFWLLRTFLYGCGTGV